MKDVQPMVVGAYPRNSGSEITPVMRPELAARVREAGVCRSNLLHYAIPAMVFLAWGLRPSNLEAHKADFIRSSKFDARARRLFSGEKPVRLEAKIGRNDPCPCGSGVKLKKCNCGYQRKQIQENKQ